MKKKRRIKRRTRTLPRTSPAVHFLRPVYLLLAGLVIWGIYDENPVPLVTAAQIAFLMIMPAIVLHSGYRRKQEQTKDIVCG